MICWTPKDAAKARDAEWLRLPGGRMLHLPTVRERFPAGCTRCGATVFLIGEDSIYCPDCVRSRRPIRGRFDVIACVAHAG